MKKIFLLPICVLAACAGCSKDNIFNDGSEELYGGGSTSGVTGATTIAVSTDEEDLISRTNFDRTISITFNDGGAASVSGDANGIVKVNGNQVTADNTATSEKVKYELSGSTSNGFFKLYSNNKQAIVLNSVSITNPGGAAINNQGKKRCFVVVNGSSTLADGSSYTQTPENEDEKAAFFSEGQLIFSGEGTLTVTAKGKSGITSDDYLHFMASPTVKVTSNAGHAVRGKDAVIVSDGVLEAIATKAMKKGVASDSLVLFNGGKTTIAVSGGTAYDDDDQEYKASAGVKADQLFVMNAGVLTITNSGSGGKGISGDGPAYFQGGTVNVTVTGSNYGQSSSGMGGRPGQSNTSSDSSKSAKGIKFDGDIYISGGSIVASASKSETIETKGSLTVTGGEIYSTSSADDAINSYGNMTISGGYVYSYSSKGDSMDANGNLTLSGGYVFAVTTAGSPEVAIDANTEGGYKLYINSGATVVAYGGLESNYSASQTVYSMSCTAGGWNALHNGSSYIAAFKAPSGCSSVAVSAPSLSKGYTGVSVGGTTYCNGIWATSGISGGSSVSLSSYSGGQGGPGGGGQGGPGSGRGW